MDNKTNLTIENYTCNLCNFSTKTLENFNVHLLTHSPGKFTEEERSYLNIPSEACFCLLCDCSCNSKAILRKHLEAVHDIKSSECGIFDSDINDEIITLQNLNQISCDLESQSEVLKLPKKEDEILDGSNTKKTCEDEKQLYSPSDISLNMQNIFLSNKYFVDYSSKLKCDFCLYLTDYKINFIRHIRIHLLIDNNEKIKKIISGKHIQYRCPYCKYVILSANLYKYHLKLYHTDRKNLWNCHICNYSTISQVLFYSHSVIHKDTLRLIKYSCFSCPYKTNYLKNLKIHQVLHLKSIKKAFLCQLCSYKTSCRLLFKCHRKLHARKKFYACPHCSFRTIFSFTFQNHLKFDFCKEKNWNEYDHLEYNMNAMAYIPHTNQELNYNIHNTFNYLGDIANNANIFFQDNCQKKVDNCYKVFACKNCDYFTPYSSNLKRHIKKHSRENEKTSPEFICDVCSYSSSNRSNLKRHLKMHTGEKTTKSIICTLCDYTTCYRSNFKRHLKMHAKGFGSNQYDYTTRIKTELDEHKTTHTRFYKECSLCDTIFTNPRAYQCHMDQAHNDKEISVTTDEEKINHKNEKELDSECKKGVKSVKTNSASNT